MVSSKMKCCSEKHIDIKMNDSHVGEFPSFLGKLFGFHIARLPFANVVFNIQVTATQATISRATSDQPLADNTPVFIKNGTFLI
jgi:hypothetical protein